MKLDLIHISRIEIICEHYFGLLTLQYPKKQNYAH